MPYDARKHGKRRCDSEDVIVEAPRVGRKRKDFPARLEGEKYEYMHVCVTLDPGPARLFSFNASDDDVVIPAYFAPTTSAQASLVPVVVVTRVGPG